MILAGWINRQQQEVIEYLRSETQALREKLGLTFRATPHSLRPTAATRIYEASGGDLILTREFLGHASVQTTQVYAHASRENMQKAVERM